MSKAHCKPNDTQTDLKPDFRPTSRLKCNVMKKTSSSKRYVSKKVKNAHSVQTDLAAADLVPILHKCGIYKRYYDTKTYPNFIRKSKDMNRRNKWTDTANETTLGHVSYRELVKKNVLQWSKGLPVLPSNDNKIKLHAENKINSLIDEINKIQSNINDINYEDELKFIITNYLDNLHICIRDANLDQIWFKEQYILDLLQRIKGIQLSKSFSKQIEENCYQRFITDKDKKILVNEINGWLAQGQSNITSTSQNARSNELTKLLINKLDQILKKLKSSKSYQKTLQEEIYRVVKDIPFCLNFSTDRKDFIKNLAEDLTRKLLLILKRDMHLRQFTYDKIQSKIFQEYSKEVFDSNDITLQIKDKVLETDSNYSSDIITQYVSKINHGDLEIISKCNENCSTGNQNRDMFSNPNVILPIYSKFSQPYVPCAISIYMSEDMIKYPLTSTPKKLTIPKDAIPKLNAEEISYMKSLADLIREWMKTLPIQLDDTESVQFKEVIINDLAGNIVYQVKKYQLAPSVDLDYEIKLLIYLWLDRFTVYDNPDDKDAAIDRLYTEYLKIPIPSLTQPQHGTRKKMKAIQFVEEDDDSLSLNEYIPKGIDILEDEISMWMNEQPENVYMYNDRNSRNNMVHKLAEILEQHLLGENTEKAIEKDVAQWLHEVIKPDEKEYIDQMIEELRDRVKNLPQEETLRKKFKERLEMMYLRKLAKEDAKDDDSSTFCNDYNDPNETMKEFLEKFIQHNYDVDDPLARNAFNYILKKELVRLNPPTRKEIYENFAKSEPNSLFAPEKFIHELEYIKLISDWLKKIPITPPYNNIKNKHRIYFIHNLAKYITEIEEEKAKAPDAMNYDHYLYSIIRAYMVNLPILPEKVQHVKEMIASAVDLVNIIMDYNYYIRNKRKPATQPATLVVDPNNLGEFINEFINEHGSDVRGDPLKLEVWMDRLMIEVQKIVRNTPDATILGKTQLYNILAQVPLPKEESIELFNTKLVYIKEITDWLKNLPLKVVLNDDDLNDDRMIKMVSELSERMADRLMKKLRIPDDNQADTDFVDFLKQWINALPLDTTHEIIIPVVIEQLMNRIDRVNKSNDQKTENKSSQVTNESNKSHKKCINMCNICPNEPTLYHKNPENAIIEVVEKFCNDLPIAANNKDLGKATKDEIAKKILQKISKLNIDPTIFNDELLFKEMIQDEVNMVLENMPQDAQLKKNTEKLKSTMIDSVVELENIIKKQSAGENYKQKLENTIEASIPNPVQMTQMYDPGFEFYKNRLATMFILENFDHSDEDIKLKYEKLIQSEVDKYFEYAANRNAVPLSKDLIQNDLYEALFKVPIPNKASIAGEVEEAKTRFEIDAWYELLPLIPAYTLDEMLERDRILSTLAKRIHEIERVEKNADPYIHKEIMKWLTKLPLLPGNEQNFEGFVNHLQNKLNSTRQDRKCVLKENYIEKDKGKSKGKSKFDKILENNQLGIHDAINVVRKPFLPSMPFISQKTAADLILEIVVGWCNQLPIPANTPAEAANVKNIKDNLAIKIVLKISELNSDPEVFDNEYVYDVMLDQEIDKLTYNLPILCNCQDKETRKLKLIGQIRSIKPVIIKEREKHEYKKELEETVSSFLEEYNDTKAVVPPKDIIEKIVDDFIEYNYNKNDIEQRSVHKSKVLEDVVKKIWYAKEKLGKELAIDPLIIRNELICKLSKVPEPSNLALQDIITEIRMKNEVEDLFQNLSLYKHDELDFEMIKVMKLNLTKKLCELEKSGHDPTNDDRIRNEISKCLKKLNIDIDPVIINEFVDQLRNNEIIRKTPPRAKPCNHDHHRNTFTQNRPTYQTGIPNQGPSQIISSLPETAEPEITRKEMVIPPRDVQVREQGPIEVSDDDESCKCTGRKTRKRKRVCINGRNFGHHYSFRRPMIPMWCRFPRFGFYFY